MISRRGRNDGFQENSIGQIFRSPVRFLRIQIARLSGDQDSMKVRRSPVEMVLAVLTFPFRLFFAFIIFMVQAWASSRNGFAFIRGIPAILTITFVLLAVWAVNFRFDRNVEKTRRLYELASLDPEYPEYAEMFAEKLVQFRPDDPENKYLLAVARERVGNMRSAKILATQLAGEDSTGLPSAHIWLARYWIMGPETKGLTLDERAHLAIKHYNFALESEPDNVQALLGIADAYERLGEIDKATDYLTDALQSEFVSFSQLQNIPRLVQMQQELGRPELAKAQLQDFVRRIRQITRYNAELLDVWVALIRCATLLKDYDMAENIIENAHQTVQDAMTRDNLIRLLADVSVLKADDFESIEDKENYTGRLYALCEAIKANKRSQAAYSRLLEYAAPDTLQEEKAFWLRDAILGCPNPAVIHVILGMQQIKAGNFVQGQKHWRIADSQYGMSQAQLIVNNMLERAVHEKPDEFGDMLDMITVAMELFPDQAGLYQTRAMYYETKNQYPEAIKDLDYVIEKMPSMFSARQLLLECYQAIDDQENADRVQQDIDQFVSELDQNQQLIVQQFLRQNAIKKSQQKSKTDSESNAEQNPELESEQNSETGSGTDSETGSETDSGQHF